MCDQGRKAGGYYPAIRDVLGLGQDGFHLRRRRWRAADTEVDMHGRTCLVTGASSGIGRATALRLAQMGADLHLVARDAGRGREVRDLVAARGAGRVWLHQVDLSDLAQVRHLAEEVLANSPRLDVLINNAGAMVAKRATSVDGHDLSLATNVLGPFLLTNLLLERMAAQETGRVIVVSSGGMYLSPLDIDALQRSSGRYDGTAAYAQDKRALVMLTQVWAQRLADSGVTVNAMHPGWVDTPGLARSLPVFRRLVGGLLRTPEQGADTIVWLAVSDAVEGKSGGFWFDRRERATDVLPWTIATPGDRQRLWDACDRLVNGFAAGVEVVGFSGPPSVA